VAGRKGDDGPRSPFSVSSSYFVADPGEFDAPNTMPGSFPAGAERKTLPSLPGEGTGRCPPTHANQKETDKPVMPGCSPYLTADGQVPAGPREKIFGF